MRGNPPARVLAGNVLPSVAVDAAQSDDRFAAVTAPTIPVTTIDNDVGWHNSRILFDVDDSGKVDASVFSPVGTTGCSQGRQPLDTGRGDIKAP